MGKKITFDILSKSSVQKAIDELNAYQKDINRKLELFVTRLSDVGFKVIETQVAKAEQKDVDGTRSGTDTTHETHVTVTQTPYGFKSTLVLEGDQVLFIEYGAGVHYNGAVGESPHPDGASLGYTIGSYGDHHGKQDTWYFKDEDGQIVRTYGTKATMPMHYAKNKIVSEYMRVARGVFR